METQLILHGYKYEDVRDMSEDELLVRFTVLTEILETQKREQEIQLSMIKR